MAIGATAFAAVFLLSLRVEASDDEPDLTMLVMDPLAKHLSCDCVKDTARRDYEQLGRFLGKQLGKKVRVLFAKDLESGMFKAHGFVDLVVGKQSVVLAEAKQYGSMVRPLAMLTGKDGKTTLTGLFVAPSESPAKKLADLSGYRILFGPAAAVEKHDAAIAALRKAGVAVPEKLETRPACTDAVRDAVRAKDKRRVVAVISSYAEPLLAGCAGVKPGEVRIIGRTEPLPFITAFVTPLPTKEEAEAIRRALLAVAQDKKLLQIMDSKQGFTPIPSKKAEKAKDAASGNGKQKSSRSRIDRRGANHRWQRLKERWVKFRTWLRTSR
jgi:ABC-type phosphate/phosphonate transport system substrate-binding protein